MAFQILPELVAQYGGTKQELARAIGITPSAFSRLPHSAPSVEVCLRLARATGANPDRVLRAAGREATADLLHALYGPRHKTARVAWRFTHTPKDQQTIAAIKAMPKSTQRALYVLIELLTENPVSTRPAVRRRERRLA